jgi:very-short-patch-repair endonuclease
MREKPATPDMALAEIASRQHGVITLEQLFGVGLDKSAITRRVQAGRLHRVHRGVYAFGNPNLSREGHWLAAVLACGEGAVLSHQSAAALHNLSRPSPCLVHVTVPGRNGRSRRKGIVIHRSTTLAPADTTTQRGIPATTVARTLRDLGYGPERTRSDLERLFLRICRDHGIPKPEVNARLDPYEVDFLWPDQRLVVEVDSWRYHSSRRSFEADRARDRVLSQRGYLVLRFTDRELSSQPRVVAASLRAHLCRRSTSLNL